MFYFFAQLFFQIPIAIVGALVAGALLPPDASQQWPVVVCLSLLAAPIIAFTSLYAYQRVNCNFEWAPMTRVSTQTGIWVGASISTVTLTMIFSVLALMGALSLDLLQISGTQIITGIGLSFLSAFYEEVIFRGVLQKKLTARFGPFVGISVSSVLFSLMHAANTGFNLQVFFTLSVFGAALLGIPYWKTSSLACSIAAHFAWNGLLFCFLGGPVSGVEMPGILAVDQSVPVSLSGGAFGIEGSFICPITAGIACWAICRVSARNHQ